MEKHSQNQEFANDDHEISKIIDHLRREFHKSLDLNHPMVPSTFFELKVPSLKRRCCDKKRNNGGVMMRCPMKDTKKRSLVEMQMGQEEKNKKNIDLSLKLSTTTTATGGGGMNMIKMDNTISNNNKVTERKSSASSQVSCMSLDKNSIEGTLESGMNTKEESSSLILRGCGGCLIYVMVPEKDPKCPKCKSSVLIDVCHHTSASKKSRKS